MTGNHTQFIIKKMEYFGTKLGVKRSHMVVDEDGVGGGVVDGLDGCRGFINNAAAIQYGTQKQNFANLKTQCMFKLADYAKSGEIGIRTTNESFKEAIIEELEQIKEKDIDVEGPKKLLEKKFVKEAIGRSPDFTDTLNMRMLPEIAPRRVVILEDPDNVTGLY